MVRAGEVAKECHVTTQAVGVWARECGCPVEMTDEIGVRWFDLAKVRAWVSANRPRALARQHGGGRPGKKKTVSAALQQGRGDRDVAPLLHEVEEEGNRQEALGNRDSGGEKPSVLVQESTRLKAAQARKHELDILERERVLVRVSEVEEAIGEAARNARIRLETMAARLTGQVLTALKLGPEHGPLLQDLVQTACDEVLAELVENPLGEDVAVRAAA